VKDSNTAATKKYDDMGKNKNKNKNKNKEERKKRVRRTTKREPL